MITRAVLYSIMVCLFLCVITGFAVAAGNDLKPGPAPTGLVWGGGGSSTDPSTEGGIWGGGKGGGPHRLTWNGGALAPRPAFPAEINWPIYSQYVPGRTHWFDWLHQFGPR